MYSTLLFKKAAVCMALAVVATVAALIVPADARGLPSTFNQVKNIATAIALFFYAFVMARYAQRYLRAGRQRRREERATEV